MTITYYIFIILILLWQSISDIKDKSIPVKSIYILIIAGMTKIAFTNIAYGLDSSRIIPYVLGAVIISLPLYILYILSARGFGGGDIKIIAALGLILGFGKIIIAFIISQIILVIYGLIIRHDKEKRSETALVPFLTIGTVIALALGNTIIEWIIK